MCHNQLETDWYLVKIAHFWAQKTQLYTLLLMHYFTYNKGMPIYYVKPWGKNSQLNLLNYYECLKFDLDSRTNLVNFVH